MVLMNVECSLFFSLQVFLKDVKTHVTCFPIAYTHNHLTVWVETTTCCWYWHEPECNPETATNFKEGRSCERKGNKSCILFIYFFFQFLSKISTLSVVDRKQLKNDISCIEMHTFYMVYLCIVVNICWIASPFFF